MHIMIKKKKDTDTAPDNHYSFAAEAVPDL